MILKIHLECRYILSMSECVCLNTFCTFAPTLRKINRGGGGEGGKVYTFGKVSSLEAQEFHWQSHRSYKKKVNVEEV